MEIWKDIQGYEGKYQISNLGRVKSLGNSKTKKEKILAQTTDSFGYCKVGLYKDGKKKTVKVHRLVADAFIENKNSLPIINHKDENPSNNEATNLEWCDHTYNNNYGTRNERMSQSNINNPKRSKPILCVETDTRYVSVHEASRKLNINYGNLCRALKYKEKTCGGYHWDYIESTLAI